MQLKLIKLLAAVIGWKASFNIQLATWIRKTRVKSFVSKITVKPRYLVGSKVYYKMFKEQTSFSAPSTTKGIIFIETGRREIITCNTYGVPRPMVLPTWWKNGELLDHNAFNKTENNSLIIQKTTVKDIGSYSCETLQVYENKPKKEKLTFSTAFDGKNYFTIY